MEKILKILNAIYTFLADNMKNKVFRIIFLILLAVLLFSIVMPIIKIGVVGVILYQIYVFFKKRDKDLEKK